MSDGLVPDKASRPQHYAIMFFLQASVFFGRLFRNLERFLTQLYDLYRIETSNSAKSCVGMISGKHCWVQGHCNIVKSYRRTYIIFLNSF